MKIVHAIIYRLVLPLTIVWGGLVGTARAGAPQWATEYELKAAFIYNLVPFVDWPERSLGSHLIIGYAGEDPMPAALAKFFNGKRIGSRSIEVRDVRSRSELRGCHVLLLAYSDRSRIQEALAQVEGTSVLTIGDGENFAHNGGVVAFVPHDRTFRLAINPRAAERAHLRISSKLLNIAKLLSDEDTHRRD